MNGASNSLRAHHTRDVMQTCRNIYIDTSVFQ